jgi:hypothetical protein
MSMDKTERNFNEVNTIQPDETRVRDENAADEKLGKGNAVEAEVTIESFLRISKIVATSDI